MDFQYSDIVEKRDLLSEEFAGGYVIAWLRFVGVRVKMMALWRFAISGEWAQAAPRRRGAEERHEQRLVRHNEENRMRVTGSSEADPNGEATEPIEAPGMLRVPICSVHIFERKRKADSCFGLL